LNVGAGRGGRTGEDPPANVELDEKAGDPGCSDGGGLSSPSSVVTAGGGDEGKGGIVAGRSLSTILSAFSPGQH
jgi:hypothetical protein